MQYVFLTKARQLLTIDGRKKKVSKGKFGLSWIFIQLSQSDSHNKFIQSAFFLCSDWKGAENGSCPVISKKLNKINVKLEEKKKLF